jgi:predicted ATP-grasp superfamily ATP-dependent carboligase
MSSTLKRLPTRIGADARESPVITSNYEVGVSQSVTYDALILDARLRQSLVAVRSLGYHGLRVAALEQSGSAPAFSSRWCRQRFGTDEREAGAQSGLSLLERALDDAPARVLIASSDDTIDLLRRHRQRLGGRAGIALAREPALGIAINKELTLDVARRLGLGIPRGVIVQDAGDLAAAVREIGLPAVIKPVESWVRNEQQGARVTSRLVTTYAEARQTIEALAPWHTLALFQQYLTGRREAVSLLYAGGTVYARFAQWASRTVPPLGGSSVLRQSIAIPQDCGAHAERLVREIELEGYSEVEFRRDGEGRPYLMEINPRLSASVEIAVRAGVDFPYLLYQWASGDTIDCVPGYRVGGWMRHLGGDIETTAMSVLHGRRPDTPSPAHAIRDFCAAFFIPAHYDYVDWQDPLPMWTASLAMARRILRR